jgi:hypothetical protein
MNARSRLCNGCGSFGFDSILDMRTPFKMGKLRLG